MNCKEQNNNTLYLVLDEASAMHHKHEPYFIIGGYLIDDINYIKSKCNEIEKKLKDENEYIRKLKEIKGRDLKPIHIIEYINFIKSVKSFNITHILVEKHEVTRLTLNENESYNFFVKWLLNFLIKAKIINNCNNLVLLLDNRTIATRFKYALETHLNLWFFDYNIKFNVKYKNSELCSYIRLADIICHSLYRINNYKDRKRTNKIISLLSNNNININKNRAFFPYQSNKKYEFFNNENNKSIDLNFKDDKI